MNFESISVLIPETTGDLIDVWKLKLVQEEVGEQRLFPRTLLFTGGQTFELILEQSLLVYMYST